MQMSVEEKPAEAATPADEGERYVLVLRGHHPKCVREDEFGVTLPLDQSPRPSVVAVVAAVRPPGREEWHVGASVCSDADVPNKKKARTIAVGRAAQEARDFRAPRPRISRHWRQLGAGDARCEQLRVDFPGCKDEVYTRAARGRGGNLRTTMTREQFARLREAVVKAPDPRELVRKHLLHYDLLRDRE